VRNANTSQLIEEGSAAIQLTRPEPVAPSRETFDVIVIGAGQAGLSVGYHLSRTDGIRFVILEANARIGDSWRSRWDSLRLFTPARFDGLDGMPFPAPPAYFPTKDEMAGYLEAYAARFRLPVRTGVRVERLFERDGHYVVRTGGQELEAPQVVIAMGKYQQPRLAECAAGLTGTITQLHSSAYRNPSQLQPGALLVVGAGNSGADIALEAARSGREVWLAGRSPGEVPFRPESRLGRRVMQPLVLRFVFHHLLSVQTALGRKVRPGLLHKAGPLIRVKSRDLAAAGVRRVPRVVRVREGLPVLEDGRTLSVRNVIWCTGFNPGLDWIDLPVFADDGEPTHRSGLVESRAGLYFVGLHFLHAMSSGMIHGVGRDAQRIVESIRLQAVRRPNNQRARRTA
jgi:putative flavoprotein involved in K+ transport